MQIYKAEGQKIKFKTHKSGNIRISMLKWHKDKH